MHPSEDKPEEWDGIKERRSAQRLHFEGNPKSSMPAEIREAMDARIDGLIDRRESGRFSSNARQTALASAKKVLVDATVWTVHADKEDEQDNFGEALLSKGEDGKWKEAMNETGHLELQQLPIEIIPHLPADPLKVQEIAAAGGLGFSYTPTRTMGLKVWDREAGWSDRCTSPAGKIATPPTARRYGEEIFGGTVAFCMPDGRMVILRPQRHMTRVVNNMATLHMADMHLADEEEKEEMKGDLIGMLKSVVIANRAYMPPAETGGRMYLSTVVYAGAPALRVNPNDKQIIACEGIPVGKYFATPLRLNVTTQFHRSAPGIRASVKKGGFYTIFEAEEEAAAEGCDKNLYLDPSNERILELGAANFFVIVDDELRTAPLTDELLEGVTRGSVLEISDIDPHIRRHIKVINEKDPISIRWLIQKLEGGSRVEAFATGTAATIHPVEELVFEGKRHRLSLGSPGESSITNLIAERFNGVISGRLQSDPDVGHLVKQWLTPVEGRW